MLHDIRRSPEAFGLEGVRWTLRRMLRLWDWLNLHSEGGLHQVLDRLHIHWKRGRWHVHSPDPNYVEKLWEVRFWVQRVSPQQVARIALFTDEFTLYRHPSLAQDYECAGHTQPLAELGHKSNYIWRIAAGLNAWTGQVVYEMARYMDVAHLTRFYQKLVQTFPDQEILLIQDNWPVHYHEDLLAALQIQSFPWGIHRPANWKPKARRRIQRLNLPIRLLFLPTYASWTNPIEKLWRLLKQEVLHLHRYEDDWPALKQRVAVFLDQFASGSQDLLRYVGLSHPDDLYPSLFSAISG